MPVMQLNICAQLCLHRWWWWRNSNGMSVSHISQIIVQKSLEHRWWRGAWVHSQNMNHVINEAIINQRESCRDTHSRGRSSGDKLFQTDHKILTYPIPLILIAMPSSTNIIYLLYPSLSLSPHALSQDRLQQFKSQSAEVGFRKRRR